MADNYLEKRMEDLRSGRLTQVPGKRGVAQKGVWCVDFPCRRVLVTDGSGEIGKRVITEFCRTGCKVAFFAGNAEIGKEIAGVTGARFIHCDITDRGSVESGVDGLMKAWRDIDIVINTSSGVPMSTLAEVIGIHRNKLPYPNDFGGRWIDVVSGGGDGEFEDLKRSMREYGMIARRIMTKSSETKPHVVAKLCVFVSAPGSEFIETNEIAVGI